ncbi:uncharacterized protein BDR25DRAFT_346840 [Lindgomyces ingoldianus]|uniref:Uncharacterized protein n=1 Tax=Lindgomyces ingoldianus TaxID=673940 RepID=A0ACB6QB56_9PLEO|nr:uncharacterized protein BDR25DRAFT_346840 [Lindgomyces ingoldianus]KAF2464147.1 hypothetical protein BDR25DRAFT_346840 [Lindgomyces ingoldianus]
MTAMSSMGPTPPAAAAAAAAAAKVAAGRHIVGYADPLVVSAGDRVCVQVSCQRPRYTSSLVRLGPSMEAKDAPPPDHQAISSVPETTYPGRPQFTRLGSFASVPWFVGAYSTPASDLALAVSFWARPDLPERAGHDQFFFSTLQRDGGAGFASFIDRDGALTLAVGSERGRLTTQLPITLKRHSWTFLTFTFNAPSRTVAVSARSKESHVDSAHSQHASHVLTHPFVLSSSQSLTIASHSSQDRVSAVPVDSTSFNGRIDSFRIDLVAAADTRTVLHLDFSKDIPTDHLRDISDSACHGSLFNCPARAVTGHDWDASETDWTRASYGYGAIHFHDDDVDDAAWATDFELVLPKDLASGFYGFVINDGESEDIVPFFIRPDLTQPPTNKVVFIVPTFTYTAYANDRMYDTSRDVHIDIPGSDSVHRGRHLRILEARPDLGISLYDSHNDGSGATHSSTKRVVLNMRPDYFHWGFGGPRELSADLWFIGFLDRELGPGNYDVITDHDISCYGSSILLRYSIAISGSHPEYPTYKMLDAYDAFLAAGGFFMYLGGNGYYWVTGHDHERPHRIEVRRADQGCRVFGLPPGHWFLALTGEQGGLWRSRGRNPNRICGLGSDACGMGQGAPYGIVPEARQNPKLEFLFKGHGLEKNDIIGDFGLVQGAASGDEIDRLDYSLGTPENAVIIATTKLAGGHSDNYALFNEEILFPMVNTLGTTSDKVRSDLVYFETGSGGAVFGVGSINWVGSLAWKNYENNVAQITANVLHEFVKSSSMDEKRDAKRY